MSWLQIPMYAQILILSVAFLFFCWGIKILNINSLLDTMLKYLYKIIKEIFNAENIAERINGLSLVALIVVILVTFSIEIGPCIKERFSGKPLIFSLPYFTFIFGVGFIIMCYISPHLMFKWKKFKEMEYLSKL